MCHFEKRSIFRILLTKFVECAQANLLTAHKEIAERNQTIIITQYYILQPILQWAYDLNVQLHTVLREYRGFDPLEADPREIRPRSRRIELDKPSSTRRSNPEEIRSKSRRIELVYTTLNQEIQSRERERSTPGEFDLVYTMSRRI